MSFQPPILDDRTFQQIVDEVRKRIPIYCPEWTDHNLSDPGITLIELFAWMTELLIYRLNQVPELHYIKFANFLGLKRRSPRAAQVEITFWLTRFLLYPQDSNLTIDEGTQVSTTQTEAVKPIIFTTERRFDIQAPDFRQMIVEKQDNSGLGDGNTQSNVKQRLLNDIELQNLRDGRDRLPMFTSIPQEGDALYFGFANDLSHHLVRFQLRFNEKAGIGINTKFPPYFWEVFAANGTWVAVDAEPDTTRGFNATSGEVTLHLPKLRSYQPLLDQNGRRGQIVPYWIRVRIKRVTEADQAQGMRSYNETPELMQIMSVTAVGCTVAASNVFVVKQEKLGVSDGSAGQSFHLSGRPVILPLNAEERLTLTVSGNQVEKWECVEDFTNSTENSAHFTIDATNGLVSLGPAVRQPSGEIRRYGAIPPRGAELIMERYCYEGGAQGNLPPRVINILRSSIPYVDRVENRKAATGGLDAMGLDELTMAVQRHLRTHRTAVTKEDFETHVYERFGNEIAWVRCVPASLRQPVPGTPAATQPQPAITQILVIPILRHPSGDNRAVYLSDTLLDVNTELLTQIKKYLDEFRLLTERVEVKKPEYQRVQMTATVRPKQAIDWEPLRQKLLRHIYAFFHPTTGGFQGRGWWVGQTIHFKEVEDRFREFLRNDVDNFALMTLQFGTTKLERARPEDNPTYVLTATALPVADREQEHTLQNVAEKP